MSPGPRRSQNRNPRRLRGKRPPNSCPHTETSSAGSTASRTRRRSPRPCRWSPRRDCAARKRRCKRRGRTRTTEYKHPFLVRREGTRAVMILVTTDKGLAGAINVNSIRAATRYMQEHYPDQPKYVTLGRKGRDFLLRFRRNVIAETSGLPDRPSIATILSGVAVALEEYTRGDVDAVLLCYAKWISTLRQEAVVRTLIPAEIPVREKEASPPADYIYEPDP
ncbi:MAG: hypothetical protein E6J40_15530, partial [Chloroflexi bacterium]